MFVSTANLLTLLTALAAFSETALAGWPSSQQIPVRAGMHSKLVRRQMKRQRVDDAQTSFQLDPSQIGPNLALTGQEVPAAGQVKSLTSTNNYINFCLTQDTDLTNGKQITSGSCNQTPMGRIISTDRMPVSRFTFPPNGGTIQSNTAFTIRMTIVNMDTGRFTNPTTTYYGAPQAVNDNGVVLGHSHVVIEKIASFDTDEVSDPRNFAFFKGLNGKANADGQLTAAVTGGLPVGFYKMTSINAAANHQPCLVAVAQHGTIDDSVYFEVSEDGEPSANNIAANASVGVDSNASASIAATASSSVAASTATASDVATTTSATEANITASAEPSESLEASSTANTSAAPAATESAAADKKGDKKKADDDAVSTSEAAPTATDVSATSSASSSAESAAPTGKRGGKDDN